MYGWELPPHNSGGLGTACLGLTEAMAALDMEIDFVVPKAHSPFPYSHMKVHSAADYASITEIEDLLALSALEQEELSQSLAYGNRVSVTADRRVQIAHGAGGSLSVTPHAQATWYAYQAAAIAQQNPGFDLIHCHDWMTYYGGIAARRVARSRGRQVPLVSHVHATEVDRSGGEYKNGDARIIAIEKAGLTAADRVVTVSAYTKQVVHKHYDIPLNKISVVHNGLPQRQPADYGLQALKKRYKIVLFMGRLTIMKGPDYFMKLAEAVTSKDPNVRFVLVGSGDMEKRCIEEAAHRGLTGKILFSSFLRGTDVDQAYQLADVFIMPSISEPFGLVALESMQNGTPVIASKQSGVVEVTKNLIPVDFWDIEAMEKAVFNVLYTPGYAENLRQKGFADLPHLSWKKSAHTLQEVYKKVTEQIGAGHSTLNPLHA